MKLSSPAVAAAGLALAAGLAGCGATSAAVKSSPTLATVNKSAVTQKQVSQFVDGTEFMQGTKFPASKSESKLELKAVVAQVAVEQWAMKQHLTTNKAAVKQAKSIITTDIESQVGSAQMGSLLKAVHLTKAGLTAYLTDQVIAESAYQKVTKSVKAPTTAQEQAYYKANQTTFTNPPQDEVSQILVKSKSLAQSILSQAKSGTAFATLAKKYSIASNGKTGGSLGYKTTTSMTAAMSTAVANLKAGQFATYHDSTGYNVIWLQAIKPTTVKPFKQVQSQIKTDVAQNLDNQAYQAFVNKLEKADKIKYTKNS